MYLRRSFADDPLFAESRIVTSIYDDEFKGTLNKEFAKKVAFEVIQKDDIKHLKSGTYAGLMKNAIDFSDAVIKVAPKLNPEIEKYLKKADKPVLDHPGEDYIDLYNDFYDAVLEEEPAMV
jgi:starch synthase